MMKRIFATLALLGAVAVGSVGNVAWAEEKPAAPAATAPAAAAPAAAAAAEEKSPLSIPPAWVSVEPTDIKPLCRGP